MKITQLITIYKNLLLFLESPSNGVAIFNFCYVVRRNNYSSRTIYEFTSLFSTTGYYQHYISVIGFLKGFSLNESSIPARREWLKVKIEELTDLLKQGYTHV